MDFGLYLQGRTKLTENERFILDLSKNEGRNKKISKSGKSGKARASQPRFAYRENAGAKY